MKERIGDAVEPLAARRASRARNEGMAEPDGAWTAALTGANIRGSSMAARCRCDEREDS
jgi:hypothetical protein